MTDKKPDKAAKGGKDQGKKGGGGRFIVFMILAGGLVPFGTPTLLVCLGLLPALVALVTDTDPQKSSFTTIAFLNLAGVLPFIIELWEKGQTMEAALGILRQPMTWLIMFGAAGVGQLILFAIPPAMTMMTVSKMEARLRTLRAGLEQLKAIWGQDVATNKSIELINKRKE